MADPLCAEDPPLIAVSADDLALRPLSKAECHAGQGILHRAFSLFLFDLEGRLLLQKRSQEKPLWPGFWANSCCSHPRWGERLADAVVRRAREELGVTTLTPPIWHFSFIYHARYQAVGSEHELCHVYSALLPEYELKPAPSEVSEYRWVEPAELDAQLRDAGEAYSPWLHIEWPRLRRFLTDRAGATIACP